MRPTTPDAGAIGDARFQRLHLQPQLLENNIFLEPHIGGQALFASMEIHQDGQEIYVGCKETGNRGGLFQRVHRIGCSDEIRVEKYAEKTTWIANSLEMRYTLPQAAAEAVYAPAVVGGNAAIVVDADYQPAVPRWRHPNLVACQEALRPDAAGNSLPLVLKMGFDLNFPISCQNNALRTLTKQYRPNPALPPTTRIDFKLHNRVPRNICIERPNVSHNQYFGLNNEDVPAEEEYRIDIVETVLCYESLLMENEDELKKIMNSTLRFPADIPVRRNYQLTPGIFHEKAHIPLPAGSRFLYVLFIHESQMAPNIRPGSYMSSRLSFPPFLDHMDISVTGKEGLVFSKGFSGLGGENARKSPSLREYHADMVRKGLMTRTFDEWVPHWLEGRGWDQFLMFDLLPYHKSFLVQGVMNFDLKWTQACLPQWAVEVYAITEGVYEKSRDNGWIFRNVI